MLGFTHVPVPSFHGSGYYGHGNGSVLVQNLACTGSEPDIKDCGSDTWNSSGCQHSEDVGVDCQTPVRLVKGQYKHAGEIEIKFNNVWVPLCRTNSPNQTADVICAMLGYSTGNAQTDFSGRFGQGPTNVLGLTDITCTGTEADISECGYTTWTRSTCHQPMGVNCRTNIRLAGGDTDQSGRVEVFYNGEWGTVCDDSFEDQDASVICSMLGLNPVNAKAYSFSKYGPGNGRIVIDELGCQGNESDVSECPSEQWLSSNCDGDKHNEDASVECLTEVRLLSGPTPSSGRLEIHTRDKWNTVCGETFDDKTATVVCNMLGFEKGNVTVHKNAYYGEGSGDIAGYGLSCTGNETDIVQCNRTSRPGTCDHSQDVGINCYSITPVRLVGGLKSKESGRVELYYNGTWTSVCDQSHGFRENEARVICRMLGFTNSHPSFHHAMGLYEFAIDTDGIGYLNCTGSEQDISDCRSSSPWKPGTCSYTDSVGVNCDPVTPLRLMGGPSVKAGVVEVQYHGAWWAVCDDSYFRSTHHHNSDVICRMNGSDNGSFALSSSLYTQNNTDVLVSNLNCTGNEADISECRGSPWQRGLCTYGTKGVAVGCRTMVRLADGNSARSGRVELFHEGTWGTVCASGFTVQEADVICKMMGFKFWNSTILAGSFFGRGSTPAILNYVNCTGEEEDISACQSRPWEQTSCPGNKVATIDCHIQRTPMRLVKETTEGSPFSGRVEIFYKEKWGTICYNGFTQVDADVICRQLGYDFTEDETYKYYYGSRYPIITDLKCVGNETDISECPSTDWGSTSSGCYSSSYYNASVNCLTSLKLENGRTPYQGGVSVLYDGSWHKLPVSEMGPEDARVVCFMLGYNFTDNVQLLNVTYVTTISYSGMMNGPECSGDEFDLQKCRNFNRTAPYSSNNTLIMGGISCNTPVRLVNGTNGRTGQLQVKVSTEWQQVCSSNTYQDRLTAQVVCRVLGYGSSKFNNISNNSTDRGIVLGCHGNEKDVSQCNITTASCRTTLGIQCISPVSLWQGRTKYMGGVQISTAYATGGISNSSFNDQDAENVCRFMKFNFTSNPMMQTADDARTHRLNSYLGIVANQFRCLGNETDIVDCIPNYAQRIEQSSYNTAFVNCHTPARLSEGSKFQHGRLEVYTNNTWYPVCSRQFTQQNGQVICRMMGHKHVSNISVYEQDHPDQTNSWMDGDFQCKGDEDDIAQCQDVLLTENMCPGEKSVIIDCRSRVRLVDGKTKYDGRLEVKYNGEWSPVCYNSISTTSSNARVMCRNLGFNEWSARLLPGNQTLPGRMITSLRCNGVEDDINECYASDWMTHNCTGFAVHVECYTKVWLSGGSNEYNGQVYFHFDNQMYNPISSEDFGQKEAEVVCRNLGFNTTDIMVSHRQQWRSSNVIENMTCFGNETDIQGCSSAVWKRYYLSGPSAGVNCKSHTAVRLVDGPNNNTGRVEVFYHNSWGTVCDDYFDDKEASVLCNMMDYRAGIASKTRAAGNGSIVIDNLNCKGSEVDISECPSSTWLSHNCGHGQDAFIECYKSRVRLQNGHNVNRGQVQIQFHGEWLYACHDQFDDLDAETVCREHGFTAEQNGKAIIYDTNKFGSYLYYSRSIADLNCTGMEDHTDECNSFPWNHTTYNCPVASVNCRPNTPIRLVDGPNKYSGRVEIQYQGTWGTVCDHDFDDSDAKVLCRMMGYNTGSVAVRKGAYYKRGNGNIIVSNLQCRGNESDISECDTTYDWLQPYENCDHSRDVGIQCDTPVRLVDGWTIYSGRVEVFYNDHWGTVCDEGFDLADAQTVCKILGYNVDDQHITVHKGSFYGEGTGPVIITDLNCTATEGDLFECLSSPWMNGTCPHNQNVGINCRNKTDIKVVNNGYEKEPDTESNPELEGRVWVKYKYMDTEKWGTVCNDHFDEDDALVLCKMLGYTTGSYHGYNASGEGLGKKEEAIMLDDLDCLGDETDISECPAREWHTHDCKHSEDVVLYCSFDDEEDPCKEGQHRLISNLDFRYINFVSENLTTQYHDFRLPLRWYSVGDNLMPTSPPGLYSCGTHFPVYLKGHLPSKTEGIVDRMACQQGDQDDCEVEYPIQVKQCHNDMYVYKLGPTVNTRSGFCLGTGSGAPPPTFIPSRVSVDVKIHPNSVIYMCRFDRDDSLYYQVTWEIERDKHFTIVKGYADASQLETLYLTEGDLHSHGIQIGFNVSCAVRAYTAPRGQPGVRSNMSEAFFAGIQILTPSITMRRGEKKYIEFKLTVPFHCDGQDNCPLELRSYTPSSDTCNAGNVASESCGVNVLKDSVGERQRFTISSSETGQYGMTGRSEVILYTMSSNVHPLWNEYKLPPVTIITVEEHDHKWRGKLCAARNDPHMVTFDGRNYEHHAGIGVYTLYRHREMRNVEIQHMIAPCINTGNPAMCNCGVAVRAGVDIYVISVCNNVWDIGYRQCGDNALTVKRENDFTYTVYLPHGTIMRARIDNQPWMGSEGGRVIDISIYASLRDHGGLSEGLCGSLDGDQSNDFNGTAREKDFIKNWLVDDEYSLFSKDIFVHPRTEPWVFPYCVCSLNDAESVTPSMSCKSNLQECTPGFITGHHSCSDAHPRRAMRSLSRKPRIPTVPMKSLYTVNQRIKRHTGATVWTKETATKYCDSHISQTKTFLLCQNVSSTHTEISLENCVLDILLMNNTDWTSLSYQSMKDSCLFEIYRNTTVRLEVARATQNNTTDNGGQQTDTITFKGISNITDIADAADATVQDILTDMEQSCLHNCSGHGICINGLCQCHENFGADDCSINVSIPARIDGLLDNGLCDEKTSECDHVYAFGELFVGSNLTCRLTEYHIDINGTYTMTETFHTRGHAVTIMEAECPVHQVRPKRSAPGHPFALAYKIDISNNGIIFSNQSQLLFIFDSTCQTYKDSNITDKPLQLLLKDGYCYIDGRCVKNGTSGRSQSLICNTDVSIISWTDLRTTTPLLTTPLLRTGMVPVTPEPDDLYPKGLYKKATPVEIRLDFKIPSAVDISDTQTHLKYVKEVRKALTHHYKTFLGVSFVGVIVSSVREGSLIVDHQVLSKGENDFDTRALALALSDWSYGTRLMVFGVQSVVTEIRVGSHNVGGTSGQYHDFLLCDAYTAISSCKHGQICAVETGMPVCRDMETILRVVEKKGTEGALLEVWIPVTCVLVLIILGLVVNKCISNGGQRPGSGLRLKRWNRVTVQELGDMEMPSNTRAPPQKDPKSTVTQPVDDAMETMY